MTPAASRGSHRDPLRQALALLDAQSGSPEDHEEAAQAVTARAVTPGARMTATISRTASTATCGSSDVELIGASRAGQEALRRAVQVARSNRMITAAESTDKPFGRLVVVPGTASADDIRRAVGTDWRRADELAYHCCDPAPIWAFVNHNKVVAFFRPSFEMSYGAQVPGATARVRASR